MQRVEHNRVKCRHDVEPRRRPCGDINATIIRLLLADAMALTAAHYPGQFYSILILPFVLFSILDYIFMDWSKWTQSTAVGWRFGDAHQIKLLFKNHTLHTMTNPIQPIHSHRSHEMHIIVPVCFRRLCVCVCVCKQMLIFTFLLFCLLLFVCFTRAASAFYFNIRCTQYCCFGEGRVVRL